MEINLQMTQYYFSQMVPQILKTLILKFNIYKLTTFLVYAPRFAFRKIDEHLVNCLEII